MLAEGLAIINDAEHIDLLFTDVFIPKGMNGRQLATEAVKRRPELKVLYSFGYTENAIVHNGRLDASVLPTIVTATGRKQITSEVSATPSNCTALPTKV
jgi:DNA-binding LytR/AlgR family response regulator